MNTSRLSPWTRYAGSLVLVAGEGRGGVDWSGAAAMAMSFPGVFDPPARDEETFAAELEETYSAVIPLLLEKTTLVPALSLPGPAVLSRAEWLAVMFQQLEALLQPALAPLMGGVEAAVRPATATRVGAGMVSAELATVLGYVSKRVMGQYDWPFTAAGPPAGAVYFIQKNIETIAARHGLDTRQLQTWLIAHELTHAVQFAAIPWLGDYLRQRIEIHIAVIRKLGTAAGEAVPAQGASLAALLQGLFSRQSREAMEKTQAVMAAIEGYADFMMARTASGITPDAGRLRAVLQRHEPSAAPIPRIIDKVIGLEMKMRQYRIGRGFFEYLYRRGGMELADLVWVAEGSLPTLSELSAPEAWVRRLTG